MSARTMLLVLLLGLVAPMPAFAQTPYDRAIESGDRALAADRFDDAIGAFESALAEARQGESLRGTAHAHFYLALTRERQAEQSGERSLLLAAERHYRESIRILPTAAASNNLARLLIRMGREEEGERLYQSAVELGEDRKGFYASNHGDFLMRQGKSAEAARAYETALAQSPGDRTLQRKWIASLALQGGAPAEEALWNVARSGEIDLAIEGVFRVLARNVPSDPSTLMTILAWSLAQRPLDPSDARSRGIVETMSSLQSHPRLREPLEGIVRLIETPAAPPAAFRWWADQWIRELSARPGAVLPFGTFRILARALGNHAEQRGDLARAEAYYQVALRLSEEVPDPNAMLDLAEVYFRRNDPASLSRVASEFEGRLFQGKGAAYAENAWDAIHEYHRALGVMYAHLGVWENPQRPYASAIFQLENAVIAAKRVNEDPKRFGLSEPLPPEPGLKSLLGEAYEKTGQPVKSIQIRLDAAEEYLKAGDRIGADEVLRQIRPTDLQQASPSLFDRHRTLEGTLGPARTVRNPGGK